MATSSAPSKLRHRSFDRFRQKMWAVPARLRLRIVQRSAVKPRPVRTSPR